MLGKYIHLFSTDLVVFSQRFPDARLRDGHIRTRKLKLPSTDLSRTLKSLHDENQYNIPQV